MHTWFDAQLDQKILDGIYYIVTDIITPTVFCGMSNQAT